MFEHDFKQPTSFLQFPSISRGTSMRIPISVIKEDDSKFDLTNYNVLFILKSCRTDFDYDDDRALITRTAELVYDQQTPPQPIINRVDIRLTSKDTWLPEGKYFFDLELVHKTSNAVTRFATFETSIVGGPNNHSVGNDSLTSDSDTFFYSDGISCQVFSEGQPIIVVTPITSQVPSHLVENITAHPDYAWNQDKENPELYLYSSRCDFITSVHKELIWSNTSPAASYTIAFNPGNQVIGWNESIMKDAAMTIDPDTNIGTLTLTDDVYEIAIFRRSNPEYRLIKTDPSNPATWELDEYKRRTNTITRVNNTNTITFALEDKITDFTIYVRKSEITDDNQQEFYSSGIYSSVRTSTVSYGVESTLLSIDWLLKNDWICLGKER